MPPRSSLPEAPTRTVLGQGLYELMVQGLEIRVKGFRFRV